MDHEHVVGVITILSAMFLVIVALFPGDNLIASISAKMTSPPTQPELLAPADGDGTLSSTPTFEWTMSKHADEITLYVDDESGFSTPLVIDQTFKKNIKSYTVPSGVLQPGKTYYWRVSAYNTAGAANSVTYSFIVAS